MPDVFDTLTESSTGQDIFDLVGNDSPTPETDKALADQGGILSRLNQLAKTPSPQFLQPFEQRAKAFVQGAGVPGSLEEVKQFVTRNPIQDIKDIYTDVSKIPERVRNIGQTLQTSPAATVARAPLSPEAFQVYGTTAAMLAPAVIKAREAPVARPEGETAPTTPRGVEPATAATTEATGAVPEQPLTQAGGEVTDAQQRSNAQVQAGDTALGVEARSEGEVPSASSGDNVVGETSGEKPVVEGSPPQEDVAVTQPEGGDEPATAAVSGAETPPAAELQMGPGAASREEYMKRYSLVGASHLTSGTTELGRWSQAMVTDFGTQIADQLPEIYERSKQVVNEFQTATGKSDVAREIKRQVGITKPLETPIMVRPFTAQKAVLLAAEKAGTAGYARGLKEARVEAKSAMSDLKENFKHADNWMAGDQEQVRKNLVEYVNATLPPAERGRFINAITTALRRPRLQGGDPAVMYKNAFKVMKLIEDRSEQVYRNNVVDDIRTTATRAINSPTVDLDAKRLLQKTLQDVNLQNPSKDTINKLQGTRDFLNRMEAAGKDVYMPQRVLDAVATLGKTPLKELPTATLDDLHTKVRLLEKIGRVRYKNRQQAWQAEKDTRMGEILAGPSTPINLRELERPQPGEKLTVGQKWSNAMAPKFNTATVLDLGTMPMDVQFDMLQGSRGSYQGPLFDHVRTPIDAAYDRAQRRTLDDIDPLREIIKKNKLTDQDEDLIGLWADLAQEGGEERAISSGVTPATIDKLRKNGLTAGQREAYDYMRQTLDKALPEIQSVMHDLFNVEVIPESNYFPWMRDYESFKPSIDQPVFDSRTGQQISPEMLDSYGKIAGDFVRRNTSKLQRGFTLERQQGAKTPIRFDSFDIFEKHIYNRNRLIEMQRDLKMAGEIIRNDGFAEKFGRYGQQQLNEWLTAAATDGRGSGNVHRMPLLDWARRASNRSLVFFRLTSNIKHASAIPQGIVNAGGPHYYLRGLHHVVSKEGNAFLQNFPQILQRQAGDMSLQELQNMVQKAGPMRLVDKYGFILGKELDAVNSRAVFLGRYLKNLEDRGIKTGFEGPINNAAAGNALTFMRRTVSSTLSKDVQPILGRGQGFGGNVSLARTMFAFRQYALERYSLLRYDTPQAFKSGNYLRGVSLLTAALAAGYYETNIGPAVTKGFMRLAGMGDKQLKEEKPEWEKLALDFFSMMPFANNLVSAVQWGESGIPLVDVYTSAGKSVGRVFTAKTPAGQSNARVNAAIALGELLGVPGAGQIGTLVKPFLTKSRPTKKISNRLTPIGGRLKPVP